MKFVVCMLIGLMLVGCCKETQFSAATPAVIAPAVPGVTPLEDIAAVLADENAYRVGMGQTVLSSGLSCALYTLTGGDRIQSSISGHNTLQGLVHVASYTLKSEINQPNTSINEGMNVLPPALRAVYKNMYLLRCTGSIVVLESGIQALQLASDDGSVLYVDGAKVIDNDNNHGMVTVNAQKALRRGVHTIRLDYAQTGAGSQALILNLNGAIMSPAIMFH